MNLSDFVVVTLYPNGEMGRALGGIWFRSATPMVFQMQPVNTLEELKAVILRNMGVAGGTMLVKRVAYRLLNIFPPNQFKFKIFWVDGNEHVCGMFDLHRRYGTREIMELLTEMQTMGVDVGGSSSSVGGAAAVIPCSSIHFTAPEAPMQSELNDDEDSDEDFVRDTEESNSHVGYVNNNAYEYTESMLLLIRHCLILPGFRLYQRDILLCRSEDALLGFQELATSSIATAAAPCSFAANESHFCVMLSRRRPVPILHH
ncbi:hypothetical protein PIB30_097301 [Stylosanthes scabra]|uniref:Uncharacterized protein n=1 Tax=Stylosanthes scabra TaxID=79078 RepID=A0ABU6ZV28_9FABA|nr:hypothetical protein [Stylosanthes scabra]